MKKQAYIESLQDYIATNTVCFAYLSVSKMREQVYRERMKPLSEMKQVCFDVMKAQCKDYSTVEG